MKKEEELDGGETEEFKPRRTLNPNQRVKD